MFLIFLKLHWCVFLSCPVETACTAGEIKQVQVYSDMFPFAYDVTQFNACLSVQTVKDNLEAITDRVHDRSFQRIILDRLNQVTTHTHLNTAVTVLSITVLP